MTTTRIEQYRLAHRADLTVLDCATCFVVFGLPRTMEEHRREDGEKFYCPNGHVNMWRETEEDRLRRKLDQAERRRASAIAHADQARAEAKHQAAVARGHKGAHQRTKNRVAKGLCPCCNRSFVDVAKHMAGQHPDFGSAAS